MAADLLVRARRKLASMTLRRALGRDARLVVYAAMRSALAAPSGSSLTFEETARADDPLRDGAPVADGRQRLFAGRVDGKVVFRMRTLDLDPAESEALLGDGSGDEVLFVFDCFTDPAHRGHGIYGQAIRWLASSGHGARCRRIVVTANEYNRAARRAVEKAGFREVRRIDA